MQQNKQIQWKHSESQWEHVKKHQYAKMLTLLVDKILICMVFNLAVVFTPKILVSR